MTLFKQVGPDRIELTPDEEAAVRAEWAANEAKAEEDRIAAEEAAVIAARRESAADDMIDERIAEDERIPEQALAATDRTRALDALAAKWLAEEA